MERQGHAYYHQQRQSGYNEQPLDRFLRHNVLPRARGARCSRRGIMARITNSLHALPQSASWGCALRRCRAEGLGLMTGLEDELDRAEGDGVVGAQRPGLL